MVRSFVLFCLIAKRPLAALIVSSSANLESEKLLPLMTGKSSCYVRVGATVMENSGLVALDFYLRLLLLRIDKEGD